MSRAQVPPHVCAVMKRNSHDYNTEKAKATPMAVATKGSNAISEPAETLDSRAASEIVPRKIGEELGGRAASETVPRKIGEELGVALREVEEIFEWATCNYIYFSKSIIHSHQYLERTRPWRESPRYPAEMKLLGSR